MSKLMNSLCGSAMLAIMLLASSNAANASTITFNFDTCGNGISTGSCGASTTYTVGGYSITATAEAPAFWNSLFAKKNGGDENGLGLTSDPTHDNEISGSYFIQLDISSILADDPLTILMDSSTGSDAWKIYESNSSGATSGTVPKTGSNEGAFTVSPTDKYLDISATSGNVLLSSLSFSTPSPTPEPSSLMLLGTGIFGLAGVARRKFMA